MTEPFRRSGQAGDEIGERDRKGFEQARLNARGAFKDFRHAGLHIL